MTADELADSDTVVAGSEPEKDDLVGQVIGDYRILERLGAGGMGVVYRAEHVLLGRPAALKVLRSQFSVDDSIVERFFNEAKAASSIRHPGIVEVYNFGNDGGRAFLVMAHLEGESLEARLKREGALGPGQAVRIARQVASALAAAHAGGIVHRDLKPDNIFLVPDPDLPGGERIQLLDFGIAKLADDAPTKAPTVAKTQTGAIMGSPLYMSPEQCQGAANVDSRTDLYALGCVLFRMLCGRLPFVSNFAADVIASHLRDEPPNPMTLRPEISRDLGEIVLRLLAKDPDERFESAATLHKALSELPDAPTLTGSNELPVPGASKKAADVARVVPAFAAIAVPAFAAVVGLVVYVAMGRAPDAAVPESPAPVEPETAVKPAPPPVPDLPVDAVELRPGLHYKVMHSAGDVGDMASKDHVVIHHERYWTGGEYFDTATSSARTPLATVPKNEKGRDEILRTMRAGDVVRAWQSKTVEEGGQAHIEHVFEVEALLVMPRKLSRPLSDGEIAEALALYRPGAEACYEHEAKRQAGMSGEMVLALTINPKGRLRAEVDSNELATPGGAAVAKCISRAIRAIRFAQTGHRREYTYRLSFP